MFQHNRASLKNNTGLDPKMQSCQNRVVFRFARLRDELRGGPGGILVGSCPPRCVSQALAGLCVLCLPHGLGLWGSPAAGQGGGCSSALSGTA